MNDAVMSSSSIEQAMLTLGENARRASRAMMRANSAAKNQALLAMADALAATRTSCWLPTPRTSPPRAPTAWKPPCSTA